MAAVIWLVRDRPPGHAGASTGQGESLTQIFAGVREAIRQPGMKRLLVAGLPMSVSTTISGAWGAPYLKDVHGLDDLARGSVLLVMAMTGMCGHFLYGQIARRLNTTKWTIIAGATILLAVTLTLALWSRPPLWAVTTLFGVLAIASAYPTITHAHARGLVPAHLIGRGVSITNMGVMTAIATAQFAFGWIIGAFAPVDGVPPEHAYRFAFGVQAAAALVAVLIYSPIRDVKPGGDKAPAQTTSAKQYS
jgi:MFS family permease